MRAGWIAIAAALLLACRANAPAPVAVPTGEGGTPIPLGVAYATELPADRIPPRLTSAPRVATAPPRTPLPTPDPEIWRFEGVVTDDEGTPLAGVCVAIGPKGCLEHSPRTDDRGVYFVDIAKGESIFDFFYEKPGYEGAWTRVRPTGPTVFNVTLKRP